MIKVKSVIIHIFQNEIPSSSLYFHSPVYGRIAHGMVLKSERISLEFHCPVHRRIAHGNRNGLQIRENITINHQE